MGTEFVSAESLDRNYGREDKDDESHEGRGAGFAMTWWWEGNLGVGGYGCVYL